MRTTRETPLTAATVADWVLHLVRVSCSSRSQPAPADGNEADAG